MTKWRSKSNLTISILLPFAGKILNKFDIRYVLTIAGMINALAFGLMGTYHSVFLFYISGIALGIGSTFLYLWFYSLNHE